MLQLCHPRLLHVIHFNLTAANVHAQTHMRRVVERLTKKSFDEALACDAKISGLKGAEKYSTPC